MPWVVVRGMDNRQRLAELVWQAQVYGVASPELAASCAEIRLPLQAIPWAPEHGHAGLLQNALYVLRPASESGSPDVMRRYLASRGVDPERSRQTGFGSQGRQSVESFAR